LGEWVSEAAWCSKHLNYTTKRGAEKTIESTSAYFFSHGTQVMINMRIVLFLFIMIWSTISFISVDSIQATHDNNLNLENAMHAMLHQSPERSNKFSSMLSLVQKLLPASFSLSIHPKSPPIVSTHNLLLSVALSESYIHKDATVFAGTARHVGFSGDIVVVVLPTARADLVDRLLFYNVSVWTVENIKCSGELVICFYFD
jgi:hypothetical protein